MRTSMSPAECARGRVPTYDCILGLELNVAFMVRAIREAVELGPWRRTVWNFLSAIGSAAMSRMVDRDFLVPIEAQR